MIVFIKSLIKQIINNIKKAFLEVFIFNRQIRRILKGNIAKHYLKKYLKIVIKNHSNENLTEDIEDYTIWQFWDKGIENAPEIVKKCVESVDKFEPNRRHIVLNMENIKDYVDIPEKYYNLLKEGKMGMAHFSDILRTYLLIKYGGCWIDSTVLLTDKLPDYIINSDLFLFQNYERADLDGLNIASYFIHSKPNNKILLDVKDGLWAYWQDNNYLMNYFLYLHLFTMVTHSDAVNNEIWAKVPFVSFIPVQHFQNELLMQFDENKWDCIKKCSSVHKLSYKEKFYKNQKDINGTFLKKFLEGELL
jgi:hypothetical protein